MYEYFIVVAFYTNKIDYYRVCGIIKLAVRR